MSYDNYPSYENAYPLALCIRRLRNNNLIKVVLLLSCQIISKALFKKKPNKRHREFPYSTFIRPLIIQ